MSRVAAVVVAVIATVLYGIAAVLPEFTAGQVGVAPIDQARPGWAWVLIAVLVHMGVVLVAAIMLALRELQGVAAGLLLGAAAIGLSLRLTRVFQLSGAEGFSPAIGSWVDLLAELLALAAGGSALASLRNPESAPTVPPAPPAGEPAAR